jgi:putative inorganic carbon (HCO3(-)) transporter
MISRVAIPLLFGLMAAGLAVIATQLDMKVIGALVVFVLGLSFLLYIGDSRVIEMLLVAALAFVIPVNLDANFFFRPHLGGAPSIGISASVLCLAAWYLVRIYRYKTRQIEPLFRFDGTLVSASLLFMFAGALSLWNARYWDLVLLEEIRLAILFLTMLMVMNLRSDTLINVFVVFLALSGMVQGGIATAQYIGGSSLGLEFFGGRDLVQLNIGEVVSRATGTIGHPNILGYYLEVMFPLVLALLFVQKRFWPRLFYLAAAACTLLGIISTVSRGAWVTVPVSGLIVFAVLNRKKLFRLGTAVQVSAIAAALIVALFFAYPTLHMRLTADDHQSAATRMPLNIAALSIIRQYPVLGVGLNNFGEVFHDYDTTRNSRIFTYRAVVDGVVVEHRHKHVVHNLFIWVWAEVGTIGLLAFLWVFGAAARVALGAWKRADEWSQAVLIGCMTGFLAQFIHGMVDPGFRVSFSVSMLLYSMLGLIGSVSLKFSESRRQAARVSAYAGTARN